MRGLIVSDANMLERLVLDHAAVRAAAEKAGLGMVLFIPKTFRNFKYKEGADKILLDTLANLATASGYAEIESAPLLPLGNSASTPFAWYVGYWKPERTIAVISCKGSSFPAPEFDKSADARDVPALAIVGEYMEWPSQSDKSRLVHWLTDREVALRMRNQDRRALLTLFVDVSRGHFDWSDGLAQILAMYIAKAAEKRLPDHVPAAGSVVLKTVDPASGWLIDANTVLADHAPPAPVHDYAGDRTKNLSENRPSQFGRLGNMEAATSSRIDSKTFWAFDQEMAEAIDRYGADQKTKAYQMVTFVEDGVPLEGAAKGYADIRFAPSAEDEMVFRLAGTYLDRTPAALSNQPPLTGHSSTPLYFECMGGPLVQLTPDTFRLCAASSSPISPPSCKCSSAARAMSITVPPSSPARSWFPPTRKAGPSRSPSERYPIRPSGQSPSASRPPPMPTCPSSSSSSSVRPKSRAIASSSAAFRRAANCRSRSAWSPGSPAACAPPRCRPRRRSSRRS